MSEREWSMLFAIATLVAIFLAPFFAIAIAVITYKKRKR